VQLLHKQAAVRNVALDLSLEPGLPRVVLDATELQQVAVNLINNSLYATPAGGRVLISAKRVGGEVQVAVQDNGNGIPPQDLERVFQPFFTTKPVGQGTGLGLAVCYGIVAKWGGTITAESEVGEGTVMTLHLPVPA
jgi:two-component system NtrC family sensor kinase